MNMFKRLLANVFCLGKTLNTSLLLSAVFIGHAGAQSITQTVCVQPSFGGLKVVFGYESRESSVTAIIAGPSNNLSLPAGDVSGRQLTAFYPGLHAGFSVSYFPNVDNPTLTWTLLGQSVSANWNTRLCDPERTINPSVALSDGVSFVTPGSNVTYTLSAQNLGLQAEQDGFSTVTTSFPAQCSSVNWTCSGVGGGTCIAAGTGNIDDLIFLPPKGRVTYLATCAIAATASGSLTHLVRIGNTEATDINSIVSGIYSISSTSIAEGNSGAAPMTFTVTRTGGVGTQTVNVASGQGVSGGSATAGVDYTPLASTLLSFGPGVNTRTVSVAILGDSQDEPDETINLILSSASLGTGINNPIGTGSIIDDDPAATRLAFSAAPVRGRINQPISYALALSADRQGAGTPAGTIVLSSGSASCTIIVPTSTPSCALQFSALGTQSISASFVPSNSNFSASATTLSANTLVFAQADLAVSKDDSVTSYQAGELLIYTIILRNSGPDAAPRVRLQDMVPNDLQNPIWSCAASAGAICPATSGVNHIDATVLTMPANAALIYTLSARVATPAADSISNRAEVFLPVDNTIDDAVLSNQSQTDVNTRQLIFADGFDGL